MHRRPTPRELLIALHAARDLPRRQVCRLAARVAQGAAGDAAERTGRAAGEPAPALGIPWADPARIVAAAGAEEQAAAALGARIVTALDDDYPAALAALAALAAAPPALVVRGTLGTGPAVAIVGSRLADRYGRETARRFALHLAGEGVAVISGMARGIDAAAHLGALAAAGGVTVGILGCGMGVDYPRGHARLAAAVAGRGAVVSEFPCGAGPRRWNFPERNRTIAALAGVTLVVQATPRSGALVTARHARELGKAVLAVPGEIRSPLSWGPHALIAAGAGLACRPEDVLAALAGRAEPAGAARPTEGTDRAAPGPSGLHTGRTAPLPPAQQAVLAALPRRASRGSRSSPDPQDSRHSRDSHDSHDSRDSKNAEHIAATAGLELPAVLAALLELEMAGRVERLADGTYRLAPGRSAPRERGGGTL